jgi:hypothetical protein
MVTIDNGAVQLVGDGAGWNGARRKILIPAGVWDSMTVTWRAWWDTYTTNNQDMTTPGWDTIACLGLGFTSEFPTFLGSGWDGFFGIRGLTGSTGNMGSIYDGSAFGSGNPGAWIWGSSVDFRLRNSATDISGTNNARRMIPANPTLGPTFTGVWVVRRDGNTSNGIRVSLGYNLAGVPRADFSQVASSPATVWTLQHSLVTDGTWWRAGGGMHCPGWFLVKNPSPTVGRKLVLDHVEFQFSRML